MEGDRESKVQYGEKLQAEIENIGILSEALNRSETMTHNMLGILGSFESRLSKLEETIIPIYQETGNLQRRHENIEKTLSCLEQVQGYYHIGEEVEHVIRDGPSQSLETYLGHMRKLKEALKYFEKQSPHSAEMAQVTTFYEAGKDALEKEFRSLLGKHSNKPVPPIIILDVLAEADEDTTSHGDIEDAQIQNQLPAKVHDDLAAIATWLQACGCDSDYMQVYATLRASCVLKSLQTLRDHMKSGSKDGSASVSASPSGTSTKTKSIMKDTPTKLQSMKRMALAKKASNSLMKHMAQLEAAGLVKPGGQDEAAEVDIDFYITSVSALLKLIQSETAMMTGIIPEKHQRRVFDMLIQSGLDSIVKEGEQISSNIKRAIMRHDHHAVISVFPVLKHLRTIKPDYDRTLEGCQVATKNKLAGLISMLDTTGAKALDQFVDSIKNNPDKASGMPPDGTVHELTSNTLIFLEQLLAFEDTAGSMLLTQDPNSLPNLAHLDRPKLKLAEFVTKVLSVLGLSLSNKSETYSDQTLRSIFMLNNFNYILKALRRSGLMELVNHWNNEVDGFYDDQILEHKRIYSQRTGLMDRVHQLNEEVEQYYEEKIIQGQAIYRQKSWSRVLSFLLDKDNRTPADLHKLKEKDRTAIKERFSGFNKEIEDLVRIQKGYAIPDTDLRESLKRDNKEFILPKYRDFLVKYRVTNFTKNPEKYIRFTEREVSQFIDSFFDAAA